MNPLPRLAGPWQVCACPEVIGMMPALLRRICAFMPTCAGARAVDRAVVSCMKRRTTHNAIRRLGLQAERPHRVA